MASGFVSQYVQIGFNFTTAQVVCVTAMINHKIRSFSAVQIYDLSYIHLHHSHSGFDFTTAQVVCVTVMINHKIISFSADQIII